MSTILVFEDTQDNFDLVADALQDKHDLVHARSGRDGLAKARSLIPDLVLLDIGLPEFDGCEVARRLKQDAVLADVPIVAVTAHAMRGDRDRCLEAGCDAYLAKPINVLELVDVVARHLGRGHAVAP